jgi:uncharacterized protein involved in exopolysaccharide biosynthesis
MRLGMIADAQRRRISALGIIPEGPSAPGLAESNLDGAVRRLATAEAAYGPDHPDVKRARREWQEALARRDGELDRFQKQRIDEQVARIDGEIREHQAHVADLRVELAGFQKRIDAAPRWGQEIYNMTRDYEVLRAKYVATVSRRADAAAAEQLLAADQPTMFRLVEAPVAVDRPVAPDRPKLLWIAVLAAIAAGLAAAGIAEWLDASMRGPEDAAALGVPVLAAVPRIGTKQRAS